jgi:hypothetical protein
MKGPELIKSDGKTYLIYDFTDIPKGIQILQNTKHLFLKSKNKPIVVIDASFEGESKSFLSPRVWDEDYREVPKRRHHNGSGLGETIILGGDTMLHNLHLIKVGLCEYDLDKTVLVYGDANIEKNYSTWCEKTKTDRVFGRCVYRPNTLLQRSLNFHLGNRGGRFMDWTSKKDISQYKPNMSFKPKHFICLNAVNKPHRFEMMNLFYEKEWQHKGHISWLNRSGSSDNTELNKSLFSDRIVFKGQTLTLDFDSEEIEQRNNQLEIPPQYREACFDIVNESIINDGDIFPTDKTWKPILQKTPFIIHGSKNIHKHLEEYFGIKPYTDLFDYRFDTLDYKERFTSIKDDNLDILLNMDINELNEIVNSDKMQKLLEYNQKQLCTHHLNHRKDCRLQGLSKTMICEEITKYDSRGKISEPRRTL